MRPHSAFTGGVKFSGIAVRWYQYYTGLIDVPGIISLPIGQAL